MADSDESLKTTYDQIAESYAARWAEIPEALFPFMQRIAARGNTGGLILDIGCGHGRDIAWFEQRSVAVIGIDISIGMLRQAKLVTSAPLVQAEMRRLPVRSSSVAAIWCCASLLHLPKSQAILAIREFERVLEKSGLIFIGVQRGIHDGPRHSNGVVRHFADYMPDEMEGMLVHAGLQMVEQSTTEAEGVSWLQTLAYKEG